MRIICTRYGRLLFTLQIFIKIISLCLEQTNFQKLFMNAKQSNKRWITRNFQILIQLNLKTINYGLSDRLKTAVADS